MIKFLRRSIPLILLLIIPIICTAQKKIKLTKTQSGKEIILVQGMRIVYTLNKKATTGILNEVHNDSLIIDNKTIKLQDIKALGKKKKGTGFGIAVLAFMGGAMIGSGLVSTPDPCPLPNCTTVESEGEGARTAVLIAGGIVIEGLAIFIATRNSPKFISEDKWKFEIID